MIRTSQRNGETIEGGLELSNTIFGSKLFIDPELEEAADLKTSLSMKFTQLALSPYIGLEEEWLNSTHKKTIIEVGTWVVVGTVQKLLTNYDWCYLGCSICTKKVYFERDVAKCNSAVTKDQYLLFQGIVYSLRLKITLT